MSRSRDGGFGAVIAKVGRVKGKKVARRKARLKNKGARGGELNADFTAFLSPSLAQCLRPRITTEERE